MVNLGRFIRSIETTWALSLQRASLSKHIRPELKSALTKLSKEATVVCTDIAADLEKHHGELLRCSSKVSRSTAQSEVQVEELMPCLKTAIESCKCQQDKIRKLQANIQKQLGTCLIEVGANEKGIEKKTLQKKQYEKDIQTIQSQIAAFEREARDKENEVSRLRNEAIDKKEQGDKHSYMAFAGTALFGFGAIVTSGGLALAFLGAEAVAAAVSIGVKHSCSETLKTLATEAEEKRRLADKATERKTGKENDRRRLEQEIVKLEENVEKLKQTIDSLKQVDQLLCASIEENDKFIQVVGDFCAALDEATLKTSVIEMVQDVIAKEPVTAQKMNVQIRMDEFKAGCLLYYNVCVCRIYGRIEEKWKVV